MVKNTYDADASVCILYYDEISDVLYLADNGVGMTQDTIIKYWMTIGRSSKKNTYVSSAGRIQTGAKGIGRFALDRIAEKCVMITGTKSAQNNIIWSVDWSQFKGDLNITEVTADIENSNISYDDFINEGFLFPFDSAEEFGKQIKGVLKELETDKDFSKRLNAFYYNQNSFASSVQALKDLIGVVPA